MCAVGRIATKFCQRRRVCIVRLLDALHFFYLFLHVSVEFALTPTYLSTWKLARFAVVQVDLLRALQEKTRGDRSLRTFERSMYQKLKSSDSHPLNHQVLCTGGSMWICGILTYVGHVRVLDGCFVCLRGVVIIVHYPLTHLRHLLSSFSSSIVRHGEPCASRGSFVM